MTTLVALTVLTLLFQLSGVSSSDWQLVFFDDFDHLNTSVWSVADNFTHSSYELSKGSELQLYTKDNVYIERGNLVLRTKYDPATAASYGNNSRTHTSGWVESSPQGHHWAPHPPKPGFAQAFGRFEIRARLPDPNFAQIWPAIWMMPDGERTVPPHACWPSGGEIDIMELWGQRNDNRVFSTLHYSNVSNADHCGSKGDLCKGHIGGYPAAGAPAIDWSADFHVWAVEWTATNLTFFVDDHMIGYADSTQVAVPQTPFYFIINTAICGAFWCRTTGPPTTTVYHYIDWIKAYIPAALEPGCCKSNDDCPKSYCMIDPTKAAPYSCHGASCKRGK